MKIINIITNTAAKLVNIDLDSVKRDDTKNYFQNILIISFLSVYVLTWSIYVVLYLVMGSYLSSAFCLLVGISSSLFTGYKIRCGYGVKNSALWMNVGSTTALFLITLTTGVLNSPVISWMVAVIIGTFLQIGKKGGKIVSYYTIILILIICIIDITPISETLYELPFVEDSQSFIFFHSFNLIFSLLISTLLINIFSNQFNTAYTGLNQSQSRNREILDNINQGLFTFNLDGTINEDYSKQSNELMCVDDIAQVSIYSLFELDDTKVTAFKMWFEMVEKRYKKMRWEKLEKLCPVKDFTLEKNGEERYLKISYQKVLNSNDTIDKIMALVIDETEAILKDRQMENTKKLFQNEMKTIFTITNNSSYDIQSFLHITGKSVKKLDNISHTILKNVEDQRDNYPDKTFSYSLEHNTIEQLYRELHTIKGNSGSLGFGQISHQAHTAEDQLEALKQPVTVRQWRLV